MKRVDTIFKRTSRFVAREAKAVVYNVNFQKKVGLGIGAISLLMLLSFSLFSSSFLFTRTTQAATISIAGTSNATAGNTIKVAVNGTVDANTTTVGATWTISNVTANTGDVITVWIDTATTAEQSTAVTKYNGTDTTGMVLDKHVLTIGSNQNQSISVTDLGQYDYDNNANIMHTANTSVLNVDAGGYPTGTYTDESINILASNTLALGITETLNTLALTDTGTVTCTGNTVINIYGNWSRTGTFTAGTSTVTFVGSVAQTITGTNTWNNLTINNTYASPDDTYDVDPNAAQTVATTLTVTDGQWTPYTGDIYKDVSIGTNGIMKPDASASISVSGNWTRTGTFTHNSSTVIFNGVSPATQIVDTGGAAFYNVSKSSTSTLQLSNNSVTIANDLTTSSGTFDCISSSYTLTVSHNANLNSGGTVNNCTMTVSNNAILNSGANIGSGTITAYGLYTRGATFNGTTSLTHNGASQDSWSGGGGNTFNGSTTITNATGAGYLTLTTGPTDTYNSNVSFVNNSTVNRIYVIHNGAIGIFKGNVTTGGTGWSNCLTWTTSSTATFSATSGTQQLSGSWASIYNLSHNAAGTLQLLTNNISVGGTFTNSAGTFDANGLTTTITGLTTVSGGEYQAKAGTQTFNGGLTISGGTFTCAGGAVGLTGDLTISSGTLTGSSSTITVSGNWDSSGGTFAYNTSTVIMTGVSKTIATTTAGSVPWTPRFYNLTIGANGQSPQASITAQTASPGSGFQLNGALTIWGTFTISANPYNSIFIKDTGTLTINSGGVLTGGGQLWRAMNNTSTPIINSGTISVTTFTYASTVATTTIQITATTYGGNLSIRENSSANSIFVIGTGSGQTLMVTGTLTIYTATNNITTTVDNTVNNAAITCGALQIGNASTNQYAIFKSGSGTITVNGAVTVKASDGASGNHNTINAGSSTWNITGNLTNNDTLTATGANFNVAGNWVQSSTGSKATVGSSTITLSGSSSSFAANGTLDSTQYNSTTLSFTSSGTGMGITYANLVSAWGNGFNNLTIGSGTVTVNSTLCVRNLLTVNTGTLTGGSTTIYLRSASPLSFTGGASGTISVLSLTFFGNNTVTVPGHTYNCRFTPGQSGGTVTQTGDITISNNDLRLNGEYTANRIITWITGGYNLTVRNITIGQDATDTAAKTLNVSSSGGRNTTVTVSGNITKTANTPFVLTDNATSTFIFNASSGTQTLDSGGQSFNIVSHSGAGTLQLLTNNLSVGGTFTNSAGTYDANGLTTTVTALATVSGGTYLAKSATQTFNGSLTISGGTFTCVGGAVGITGNMTLSSGILTGSSSTITVSGNWDSSGGTFTYNTSTVIMTGVSKTMATPSAGVAWDIHFYNLTIGANAQVPQASVTAQTAAPAGGFQVANAMNLWGTFTISGSPYNIIFLAPTGTLDIKNTGSLSGAGNFWRGLTDASTPIINSGTISAQFTYAPGAATTTAQITATTYSSLYIRENSATSTVVIGSGSGQTLTATSITIFTANNGRTTTLDNTVNNANIICTNLTIGDANTNRYAVFKAGSGNIDINGSVTVYASDTSGVNEIQAGSSQWTVSDGWTNSDTFTAGTSTVTFDGSVAQAITGSNTWNNLTIANTYATPSDTYDVDPNAAQTVSGTLTVTDGQWTPNTGDSYGAVSIGTDGIMKPDSSASISVSGNWTNNGTFTHNSGTVTLNGTGTSIITGSAAAPSFAAIFNNFTATAGKTINFTNGKYFKVVGAFNLSGTSGSHVVVNSSDNTNQWYVNYQPGGKSIAYADISNSGCDATNSPITANIEADNTNSNIVNNGYCWFSTYLSFSMDANTITFDNLNNANNWTNTKTSTFTTSTNARNGYVIQGYITDFLTSLAYPSQTISDFTSTWATPALWDSTCNIGGASYCGFGYTSNDGYVQGSNRFLNGTKYASYSHSSPGDVLADHGTITSEVTNEQFTITHKASVPTSQAATTYQTILTVIITANY